MAIIIYAEVEDNFLMLWSYSWKLELNTIDWWSSTPASMNMITAHFYIKSINGLQLQLPWKWSQEIFILAYHLAIWAKCRRYLDVVFPYVWMADYIDAINAFRAEALGCLIIPIIRAEALGCLIIPIIIWIHSANAKPSSAAHMWQLRSGGPTTQVLQARTIPDSPRHSRQ